MLKYIIQLHESIYMCRIHHITRGWNPLSVKRSSGTFHTCSRSNHGKKVEHYTFGQNKIRLGIPFADNWSQKSARNVIPFSSILGIWQNAGFRQMTRFIGFPVSVHCCCITVYPCNRPGIVPVVAVQPILIRLIRYLAMIICYFKERDL